LILVIYKYFPQNYHLKDFQLRIQLENNDVIIYESNKESKTFNNLMRLLDPITMP